MLMLRVYLLYGKNRYVGAGILALWVGGMVAIITTTMTGASVPVRNHYPD